MAIRATQRARNKQNVLHYCCDYKLAGNHFYERLKGGFVLALCKHHRYAVFLYTARTCEHLQQLDHADKKD